MTTKRLFCVALLAAGLFLPLFRIADAAGATYHVSSTDGNDAFDGRSPAAPFETIAKVNLLDLQPGDQVLFKCGDTWRVEQLLVSKSGTAADPISFASYPANCENQPILSGAQPIAGWTSHSTNIYVADLSAGPNAAKFAYGVNQLFGGDQRLPMGRWPNLEAGDGGYSTIDGQPASNRITDNQLPAGDWTGAAAHIKGMRWYILNRRVTGDSSSTLTLGADVGCWGACTGWGFFLNNHLDTLDQEGEWYYDAPSHRVYLFTAGGLPADDEIEGSVVLKDDDRSWGGVTLGVDLTGEGISYIVVENLDIRRWFRHGIATPTNYAHYESHHLTLQNNTISDMDGMGINLMVWVYDAWDGRPDGWRGGYNIDVSENTIDTVNRMGINTYGRQSTISDNLIRDVGLIENLGAAGMGCAFDHSGGRCTEDGDGIRIKIDKAADTGNTNTVTGNRLERIAHNGIDVFGHHNTFERNVIRDACYAKGDCGGVRTFGRDNLSQTAVHDLLFSENLVVDTLGNTDGCHSNYDALFGFGFYIDNYSRDVTLTGNTVISSTVHGVLYQNSTGRITDNTLYNNSRDSTWAAQVWLTGSPTQIAAHQDNVLYSLNSDSWTLSMQDPSRLAVSDRNYFFSPYRPSHIRANGDRSLSSWQAYSGQDPSSVEHWFTLSAGDDPLSRIFYNDANSPQIIDLGTRQYLDLDQNQVLGSITLQAFESMVLIDDGEAGLTLLSMAPQMWGADKAADFTLTLRGAGFTGSSVVRWDGSARPTSFVGNSVLTATILASDVSAVADVPVTVYDPTTNPTETLPLTFRVLESVARVYLPLVLVQE